MAESLHKHRPVMVDEVLAALEPREGSLLLDGTVGQGGHAAAWIEAAPWTRVIGFDRDPEALATAGERLRPAGERACLYHADYRDAPAIWRENGLPRPDAILLDLGLGSHQLEDPSRGFSFRFDGPLDMRFDPTSPGPTAGELIHQASEPELERWLSGYGEERHARKLARLIVRARERQPLKTTTDLAQLVRSALSRPGKPPRIDPATRTFQALRIVVNRELEELGETLEALIDLLGPGGRVAVLAFHSLEDRIVKRTLRGLATEVIAQPGDPLGTARAARLDMPVRKVTRPTDEEAFTNPRARSARLRWGIRR